MLGESIRRKQGGPRGLGVMAHLLSCGPLVLASAQAKVPGTYVLLGGGACEARCLHEVPLGLTLQPGRARQRDVRLWRE